MKRLLTLCLATSMVTMAFALAAYSKPFNEKYGVKAGSALANAKCAVCHVKATGGKLNPYGKDIAAAVKADGAKKMTAAHLAKVEGLDSDGDGKKNVDEIKADSNPGVK